MTLGTPDSTARGGAAFPSTQWSRIVGSPSRSTLPDVEGLAAAYWRPVFGFIRASRGLTVEEARDCTQDFFVWMLEQEFLAKADPERGRFRGFLKTALRNFLNDQVRRQRAAKRGGDVIHVRIEFSDGELSDLGPDWRTRQPDEVLDALWRTALVERATRTLEDELLAAGKDKHFAVFRDYFLDPEEGVDYSVLADRHGLSNAQVSNYLMYAKRRYRGLLRAAVMETVSAPEDLDAELRWLFEES